MRKHLSLKCHILTGPRRAYYTIVCYYY